MDRFKKISKSFITFLLTFMIIFQSVAASFIGSTTSFADNQTNQVTITIKDTENGELVFNNTKEKSITAIKGSNVKVLVNPKLGYETNIVKMEQANKKTLELPVNNGEVNVPVIGDATLHAIFTESKSQPVEVEDKKEKDITESQIEEEKKENKSADINDNRDRKYKEDIDDSKTIAEILLKADRTKVGQGTSVVAKDIVTVANTVINMTKTKARNLDELWKDRDGDGISDDWMAIEGQFDNIIPLYEVDEKANYYVAKPNLAKIENSQLLQYIIADSNRSGTLLKTVIYEKESGLLYVPKNILYPSDIKDKESKRNFARLGRTRIQFLLGINDEIDKTKTDVEVKIDKNDSMKGDVVVNGKATINTMSDDTKIVLAKDNESKKSIKANSIDEIRVNGHEVNLNDVTYYEKEGVLELPLKPAQADSIEIKMSNSIVKDITNTIGSLTSFIKPLISFAGEPSKKISKVIYFTSTPRKGDWWHLRGDNNTRNVNDYGARFPEPGYEKTYATNTYSDSRERIRTTVKMILHNQLSQADANRISREMGNEKGTNYYSRNSFVSAQTATGSGNADMIIKQGFGLSLNCAHAGVNDQFAWDPTYANEGVRKDKEGIVVRLLDTDGSSWALFAAVSPSQSTQAGYGFFGANINVTTTGGGDTGGGDTGGGSSRYSFRVKKVDDDTGETLSGATFKVTQTLDWGESAPTQYKATGYSGTLTFDNLPAGTYEIEETNPPSGYKKIDSTQTITLPSEDGYEVTFRNTKDDIPPPTPPSGGNYAISMMKVDGRTGLAITGYPSYSAKFKVKDPDGMTVWADKYADADTTKTGNVYTSNSGSYNNEFEIDSVHGVFTILGLEKKGTYTIEEVSPPSGYEKSSTTETVSVSDYQDIGSTRFSNYKTPPEKPKNTNGTLVLKKKDEDDNSPIEKAYFQLNKIQDGNSSAVDLVPTTNDGEYIEKSLAPSGYVAAKICATNSNGEITILVKDTGIDTKYQFEEIAPADGYETLIFHKKTKTDWVVSGETETFEMTNKKEKPDDKPKNTAKISFTKREKGGKRINHENLYFAKFELIGPDGHAVHLKIKDDTDNEDYSIPYYRKGSGDYIVSDTSDNTEMYTNISGDIEIDGITRSGKYKIREITPPSNYKKSYTPIEFNIEDYMIYGGVPKLVKMENEPDTPTSMKINKVDSKTRNRITDVNALRKAEFKLTDPNGYDVKAKEISKGNYKVDFDYGDYSFKLSDEGTLNISGLVTNGSYKLKEIKAPDGYKLAKSPLICDVEGKDNVYNFENEPIPKPESYVIRVHKENLYNRDMKLKGVVFELLNSDKDVVQVATTNSEGIATFSGLKNGTYYVREKSTIKGYRTDTVIRSVEITSKNNVADITVFNSKEKNIIAFTKYDSDTKEAIYKSSLFKLFRKTTKGSSVKTEQVNLYYNKAEKHYYESVFEEDLDSSEKSNVEHVNNIIDIKKGESVYTTIWVNLSSNASRGEKISYYFEEIKPPEGYKLPANPLSEEKELKEGEGSIGMHMYNEPIVKRKYNMTVTKTDSVTGKAITDATKLQNAEFRLKEPDGKDVYITKVSDGVYKKDNSSNYTIKLSNEGKLTIQNLDKKGKYTLTEVKAPTGYQLSNTPLVCDVVNVDNSFTFKNAQIPKDGSVTIIKKDSKNQNVLSGVTFELLDKDKKLITTSKTGSTGIAGFSNLEYGKYYIREKETISGYKLDSQLHEINISNANKAIALSLYNEPIEKTIKVIKKDNNGELLKDAEFTLFKKDGSTLTKVESKVTNTKGEIEFSNLRIGQYILRETKAPNGFRPYSKDIEIDLTKQMSPVYTVTLNNYEVEENIPSTGTRGATVFLASGLGIIMLAYIFKKKKIYA